MHIIFSISISCEKYDLRYRNATHEKIAIKSNQTFEYGLFCPSIAACTIRGLCLKDVNSLHS